MQHTRFSPRDPYIPFALLGRFAAIAFGLVMLLAASVQAATDPFMPAGDTSRQFGGADAATGAAQQSQATALPAWVIVPDDAAALRGVLHPPRLGEPGHGRVEFDSQASVEQLVAFYEGHFQRAGFAIRIARDIKETATAERTGIRAGLAIDHRASGRTLDVIIHEREDQRLVRLRYRGS